MDTDHITARLGELFSHHRWILLSDVSAHTQPVIDQLREWGGSEFLVVAGQTGVGDQPEVEVVHMPSPPGTVMEGFRRFAARVWDPPPEVRRAVDRFDQDGTARVIGPQFGTPTVFLGRRLYGARPEEWEALEDKTKVDAIWDEAGVARAPSVVVELDAAVSAAADLAGDMGTVWAADNTEGWHGGGEYVRWVGDVGTAARTVEELRGKAHRVRVMPFLDGIPCSIHGVVTPDGVAALRPVELLILRKRNRTGFVYAGVADTWDPPLTVRDEMRSAARSVGEVLRRISGHRGPFSIDGVATTEGFRPTELNPRSSVGYGIQAGTVPELLGSFFVRALVEGDLDVPARWLEELIVTSADASRVIRMGVPVTGSFSPAVLKLAAADGAVTVDPDGDTLEIGPSPTGSFMLWRVDAARIPPGAPFGDYAAQAVALAVDHWNVPIASVVSAVDVSTDGTRSSSSQPPGDQ